MSKKTSLLFNIHPGVILKDVLTELSITQSDFARHINVLPKVISEICCGHRGISPEMSVKLSIALDMTAEFWLNAQQNYNLSQVDRRKLKKIKKLVGTRAA